MNETVRRATPAAVALSVGTIAVLADTADCIADVRRFVADAKGAP